MKTTQGFTLIELSIVLVIIGLIVGGVLVGNDLIQSARTRATISQVEKYNTAVNTFYGKYGGLPGDLTLNTAKAAGLTVLRCPDAADTTCFGEGNGDGLLGSWSSWFGENNDCVASGENAVFWVDLTQAGLIDQSFAAATESGIQGGPIPSNNALMPTTPINSTFIYVYTNGGVNYYGLSALSWTGGAGAGAPSSALGVTVIQAYNIDRKIDDAMPQSGNVLAQFLNYGDSGGPPWNNVPKWAMGGLSYEAGGGPYAATDGSPPGTPTTASDLSCYDNGGSATAAAQYSVSYKKGTGLNCALSFKFQ